MDFHRQKCIFHTVHITTNMIITRVHILPLRRRGHATLHDQNSKRVTKNSNKWVMIVICIHTYVREYSINVSRLLNIVYV